MPLVEGNGFRYGASNGSADRWSADGGGPRYGSGVLGQHLIYQTERGQNREHQDECETPLRVTNHE